MIRKQHCWNFFTSPQTFNTLVQFSCFSLWIICSFFFCCLVCRNPSQMLQTRSIDTGSERKCWKFVKQKWGKMLDILFIFFYSHKKTSEKSQKIPIDWLSLFIVWCYLLHRCFCSKSRQYSNLFVSMKREKKKCKWHDWYKLVKMRWLWLKNHKNVLNFFFFVNLWIFERRHRQTNNRPYKQ